MLTPPTEVFRSGESFSSRVRHIIGDVNDVGDLRPHWEAFAASI
jgi:hypothetical protein